MARLFIVAQALLASVALTSCTAEGGDEEAAAPPVSVEIGQAVVRDYRVTVTALGTISARPGGAARISAPGESFVTAVRVAPGDAVEAGAPLVELDRSVWAQRAAEADAALTAAEQERDRVARLVERGILPQRDLETASAARAQAAATAADARRTLDRAVLRSPISGVVTAVNAAVAQPVTASDILIEVIDLTELDALVQLTPETAAMVSAGDSVQLFSGLDPREPAFGTGTVRGVSSQVASTSGTVVARVALSRPERPVRVGLTLSARIVVATHAGAVVVPSSAIVPITNGFSVYVVDAQGVAHETSVEVGAADPDSTEVVSGLSGEEQVVLLGAYGIADGVRVEASTAP